MPALSAASKEHLTLRLASRTGLQTTTCRNVLSGRYRKYNRGIQLRALEGIRSILTTDQPQTKADSSSAADAISFLGNLAGAIAAGFTQFGSNLAKGVAAGVAATVTSGSEGGEGDSDGDDTGGGEEEGEGDEQ